MDRAIPILEGTSAILDGGYRSRVNPIQKCFALAKSLGYSIFAVQDRGQCAGGPTAENTYKKFGPSNQCHNGMGGGLANDVYEIQKIQEGIFLV